MKVRQTVHAMGFRYRLHRDDLPGCPDLVFPSLKKVIFVHGCYWHRHRQKGCKLARLPKSNIEFWRGKLEGNRERDIANMRRLRQLGWRFMIVWECQLNDIARVERRISWFLSRPTHGQPSRNIPETPDRGQP